MAISSPYFRRLSLSLFFLFFCKCVILFIVKNKSIFFLSHSLFFLIIYKYIYVHCNLWYVECGTKNCVYIVVPSMWTVEMNSEQMDEEVLLLFKGASTVAKGRSLVCLCEENKGLNQADSCKQVNKEATTRNKDFVFVCALATVCLLLFFWFRR